MIEHIPIAGLTHQEQDTLDVLLEQLKDKIPRNLLRAAYYDGKNAIHDLGISTPPNFRRICTVLGWSAKAVDVLNRRCKLDGFVAPGEPAVKDDLDDLWEANFLDTEAPQAGVSSLIHATAFLIATQGDVAAGEPEVIVTSRDALSGTGVWDRRRRVLSSFLSIIETNDDGDPVDMVMYLPGLNVSLVKSGGAWTINRRTHDYGVPVEPLVYQPQLRRPFGSSRISRSVMSLQDAATRTMIRSEVTAELYSVPQRVLLGADESAFKNADGTVKTAWQAVLGRVWAIPDDDGADVPRADIKEFSQGSQDPHMAQFRGLAESFAGETSIPMTDLGVGNDANPTSAEAYHASREPLISEAEGTTDGWTPAWKRTLTRALDMKGVTVPSRSLGMKWRSAANPSRAAQADAGLKTIQAFPWIAETEVGLEMMGFDDQQIVRLQAERRRVGGSAALRAITDAAAQGRPVVTVDDAAAS